MQNGYALASEEGLRMVARLLRVGIHRETEVTLPGTGHTAGQVYISALPMVYSEVAAGTWAPFAKLMLEVACEATLRAGVQNGMQAGNWTVYLTLLGGRHLETARSGSSARSGELSTSARIGL